MQEIAIAWYLGTFLVFAMIFSILSCTNQRREQQRFRNMQNEDKPIETPPPTPAPSYSEFAPPSYESVIKANRKSSVFIININEISLEGSNSSSTRREHFY